MPILCMQVDNKISNMEKGANVDAFKTEVYIIICIKLNLNQFEIICRTFHSLVFSILILFTDNSVRD